MLGRIKSSLLVKSCRIINSFRMIETKIKDEPKNILIINAQGVGDMVVFTPVIEALGNRYPKTNISVVTSKYGAEILKNNPFVFDTIISNSKDYSWRELFSLAKKLRSKKFDVVIDTMLVCFSLKTLLLPFLIGAKHRIYFKRKGFSHFLPTHEVIFRREHMIKVYGRIAELFDIKIKAEPKIYYDNKDKVWAENYVKNMDRPIILVHPSCKGDEKIWPATRFAKLISWLKKGYGATILITSVNSEKNVVDIIRDNTNVNFSVLMNLSLQQIAALLKEVDLLVSVDTGIVHIATTTNTPTVCIYGITSQLFWKPYNKNQIVVQADLCSKKANQVDVEQVIIHPEICPKHGKSCINHIGVSDVKKVINKNFLILNN